MMRSSPAYSRKKKSYQISDGATSQTIEVVHLTRPLAAIFSLPYRSLRGWGGNLLLMSQHATGI